MRGPYHAASVSPPNCLMRKTIFKPNVLLKKIQSNEVSITRTNFIIILKTSYVRTYGSKIYDGQFKTAFESEFRTSKDITDINIYVVIEQYFTFDYGKNK